MDTSEPRPYSELEAKQEIERKFLIEQLPENLDEYEHHSISQTYLNDDNPEERVRRNDDSFFFTRKTGVSGVARGEEETEISEDDYHRLLKDQERPSLQKTRYIIPVDGGKAELDIYGDALEGDGHITVEVEFDDMDSAESFKIPDWFGREVTGFAEYQNFSLAKNGWPEEEKKAVPEYELEEGVSQLISLVQEKVSNASGPVIVEVAGGSASGKTSAVAAKVRDAFGEDAQIISMDNYYKGLAFMNEEAGKGNNLNWDQPEALDLEQLKEDLSCLKSGQPTSLPRYDFPTWSSVPKSVPANPTKVIIVEGLFALNEQVAPVGDVHAFVEIGAHGRIMRRLMRDVVERPGKAPQDIIKYFADVVEPMHERYIQSTKKNADIVISNEYSPEVEASRSGLHEVQLKFKGEFNHEQIRMAGAELLGKSHQIDKYYNPKDRDMVKTGEILRVREESESKILTYKGPKVTGKTYRERPKFEFEIDDETEQGILGIYGDSIKTIEKDRTMYQLDGIIFTVDRVKSEENGEEVELGEYVEIRGSQDDDNSKIGEVIQKLGLDLGEASKQSYFDMAA